MDSVKTVVVKCSPVLTDKPVFKVDYVTEAGTIIYTKNDK